MSTPTTSPRRRLRRSIVAIALTAASLTTIGALPASAAPKDGCGATRAAAAGVDAGAGWKLLTVEQVAARLAGAPSDEVPELVEWLRDTYDRNGDGKLCLTSRWGDRPNENAHWYRLGMDEIGQPYDLFLMVDNTANAKR